MGFGRGTLRGGGGIAYVPASTLTFGAPPRPGLRGLAAFRGVLDEIALYRSALGARAVREHFRLGAGL